MNVLKGISVSTNLKLQNTILDALSLMLQSEDTINVIPVTSPSIINSLYKYYSIYNLKINTDLQIFF